MCLCVLAALTRVPAATSLQLLVLNTHPVHSRYCLTTKECSCLKHLGWDLSLLYTMNCIALTIQSLCSHRSKIVYL